MSLIQIIKEDLTVHVNDPIKIYRSNPNSDHMTFVDEYRTWEVPTWAQVWERYAADYLHDEKPGTILVAVDALGENVQIRRVESMPMLALIG